MDEQYYALCLDDPATPAFCSFDKLYVGTKTEMDIAIKAMRENKRYENTVMAYDTYWQQGKNATHNIAFREVPILIPSAMRYLLTAKGLQLPKGFRKHGGRYLHSNYNSV